jgi:predicted O-methyltransferase YrrM
MSTLTSPPLADLLVKLYADAEASDAKMRKALANIPPDELKKRLNSEDYRGFYMMEAKDYYLSVSPETARLLYMLARSINARSIVEFGTSLGISTLHLAAALKDNGGGRLIGSEFEPSKVRRARANVAAAGLADYVDIREGDALETFARAMPSAIDLVLLDGAKSLYVKVLDLLEPHLRPGALLIADNADLCPDYLARVRAAAGPYLSVPFVDDVELSMKL